MKKGKLPALLVFSMLALVAVVLFLFLFPSPFNSERKKTIKVLDKKVTTNLIKNENQGEIVGLSLKIKGSINGEAIIKHGYSDSSFFRIDTVSNEINLSNGGDWYQNNYILVYEPLTATKGELEVKYRFKGMNNF